MQTWPAPAKLNLFLHVVGRRADGYHLLQTVFQFLDYGDALSVDPTGDGRIVRATPLAGVPEDNDLTVRAARLLQAHAGITQGAVIRLTKILPMGGGLGGGSSDAATTLIALNRLWGVNLPLDELAQLGVKLGADVPTPVELPEPWYVVLVPPVHVSTAEVFRDSQLTHHTPAITIRDFLAGRGRNDLEAVVRRRYPEVASALDWLRQFGDARLTGSGGCVFLAVPDEYSGRRILEKAETPVTGFVARGVNRHPLYILGMPAG
jgi:4-diphosphocytidyl-2-C-methyl-D-erythritol kinase